MPEGRRTRALVVEDDFATASTLIQGLTRAGFEVSLSSGEEDWVPRSTPGQIDIAIVDLHLMEQRGLDLIRAWRGRSSIPIIALATRAEPRATLEALALGAADCVAEDATDPFPQPAPPVPWASSRAHPQAPRCRPGAAAPRCPGWRRHRSAGPRRGTGR